MSEFQRVLSACHSELAFEFIRSSGPGGQNVNKVATAAQLRFDVRASSSLRPEVKVRLKRIAGRRMTAGGQLVIEARRFRTQEQNRADAIQRFDLLVLQALQPPRQRVRTKATLASREKRLQRKKKRGMLKKDRQTRASDG